MSETQYTVSHPGVAIKIDKINHIITISVPDLYNLKCESKMITSGLTVGESTINEIVDNIREILEEFANE